MKQGAALLLVVILAITTGVLSSTTPIVNYPAGPKSLPPSPPPPHGSSPPPPPNGSSPPPPPNGSSPPPPPNGSSPPPPPPPPKPSNSSTPPPPAPWRFESLMNPHEMLLQEIRSLDEEATVEQKELVKAMKANADGKKVLPEVANELEKVKPVAKGPVAKDAETFKEPLAEELIYNETDDILMNEDPEWNSDDDDDDDDDDEDDEFDDEIDDEEEILFQQNCPIGCRCLDRYVGAITARCSQFSSEQTFGPDMTHITIENVEDIELGPHALREKGLQQLQSISIIDTRISSIDRSAFDGIPDLFAVNLTRNGLLGINPDVFENNTQLQLLTISGNPLQLNQGKNSPKYLLNASNVFDLDLSANALPRLLPTAFTRTPRLEYLNLRNNKIRAIDRATFKPLEELEELDLSNNQLNGLPADVFDDNKYLELLKISGNNLSTLATIKSSSINSLDASKNRIRIVAKDDLDGITALQKLYLRANGLKRIHPHAFADLTDLSYLDISDNKLSVLEEHHFRTNSRLETLIMNDNPGLVTLPVFKTADGTFSVTHFECADCGLVSLSTGTFDAMPAMTRLNLARNQLTKFPKGLVSQMSALRELDLSDNMFRTIDVDMFRGARTLMKLNLAGNPIATLTVAPFLLTPSLARLDVSRCGLEKIWTDPIVPIPSLRFVSIRGNRIERINVEDLEATPKLSGFDISHNPIACDQEFNAVVQWLVDHGVSPTETLRYMSNYGDADDYSEPEGYGRWTDLAKAICDSMEAGPPPRKAPRKPEDPKVDVLMPRNGLDELSRPFDHGISENGDDLENAWLSEDQEYEEYAVVGANYRPWYSGTLWPVMTVILVTLAVVLFVANLAVYLSKRRGRGPVIRAPLILRPGLIDNKNCGLVYKQLQEEIPTPQMAKRGSFYSSSTFHYDKIVPESV